MDFAYEYTKEQLITLLDEFIKSEYRPLNANAGDWFVYRHVVFLFDGENWFLPQ